MKIALQLCESSFESKWNEDVNHIKLIMNLWTN
jgi:hypothetical protein